MALLGLLDREPSHGYDLKRDYDAYFGRGRPLPFGQVYATLARLARDGKAVAGDAEPGAGPDRKRYTITEKMCIRDSLYSAKAGATATYQFSGSRLVSFVSDTGPSRGEVALSINGGAFKDVKLSGGSSTVNRVVVWNSGFLNDNDSYTLTVKVVSGRVDVEGFITN